jgi:hypothetical protein
MGKKRNAYKVLVRKLEGNRQLGRPRRTWQNDIKMNLRETGWVGMDWIRTTRDRGQRQTLVN